MSQSFDWPHFHAPIDQETVARIRVFLKSLSVFETTYPLYTKRRQWSFPEEQLRFRLHKVLALPLYPGMSFADLFRGFLPRIGEGLDSLRHIASQCLQRPVGDGTALLFLCGKIVNLKALPPEAQEEIRLWVSKYGV